MKTGPNPRLVNISQLEQTEALLFQYANDIVLLSAISNDPAAVEEMQRRIGIEALTGLFHLAIRYAACTIMAREFDRQQAAGENLEPPNPFDACRA